MVKAPKAAQAAPKPSPLKVKVGKIILPSAKPSPPPKIKIGRIILRSAKQKSKARPPARKRPAPSAAPAPPPAPEEQSAQLITILKKEDQILAREQKIEKDEKRIEHLESTEVQLEHEAIAEEKKEDVTQQQENTELAKLAKIENEVRNEVLQHPLTKITLKDFMKGLVGGFIGVVVHFTFTYGVELAQNISVTRATVLYLLSFLIGAGFLYGTGFRKITDKSILWLLPYRILVLYSTAVLVTFCTLAFFYTHFFVDLSLAYRQVAVVNLSAVIGACTADLIGRE
jgi:uncharacterized membrane protein